MSNLDAFRGSRSGSLSDLVVEQDIGLNIFRRRKKARLHTIFQWEKAENHDTQKHYLPFSLVFGEFLFEFTQYSETLIEITAHSTGAAISELV